MNKKFGGVITNWQVHTLSATQEQVNSVYPDEGAQPLVFTGTVLKDSPKFKDGWHMRSSLIVDIDREQGIIETLNTIYFVKNEGGDTFDDIGDAVLKIFY